MSNFQDSVTGLVAGDNLSIRRTITDIPVDQTLVKAWLTVKSAASDADEDALVQKAVTTTDTPDVGQITDDGTTVPGTGAVRFELLPTDTVKLVPPLPNSPYLWDLQVRLSTGAIYTPLKGTIAAEAQITLADS